MNNWKPITISELQLEIEKGLENMSQNQLLLWNQISIKPQKWSEHEYGSDGGGFWVVAKYQNDVIWYNDIEEGFNISPYSKFGTIDEYGVEQDELQWTLNKLKQNYNTM